MLIQTPVTPRIEAKAGGSRQRAHTKNILHDFKKRMGDTCEPFTTTFLEENENKGVNKKDAVALYKSCHFNYTHGGAPQTHASPADVYICTTTRPQPQAQAQPNQDAIITALSVFSKYWSLVNPTDFLTPAKVALTTRALKDYLSILNPKLRPLRVFIQYDVIGNLQTRSPTVTALDNPEARKKYAWELTRASLGQGPYPPEYVSNPYQYMSDIMSDMNALAMFLHFAKNLTNGQKTTLDFFVDNAENSYSLTFIATKNDHKIEISPIVPNVYANYKGLPTDSGVKVYPDKLKKALETIINMEAPQQGGSKKISSKQKSAEKVMHQGKHHVVYLGPRGGRYIKVKGEFQRI